MKIGGIKIMKVTKTGLGKIKGEYSGYLEGEKLDRFFEEFEIKFAAGHWAAGSFADRFAPGGYSPELEDSIVAQIERVAKAGIEGIEFHEVLFIDRNYQKHKGRIAEAKEALARYKVKATNTNINLFSDSKW